MSDDSQHLSENMTEEAFQLRTLRGMIYRKIKQKKVNTEVQKDVKSTSLKCMILWKPLDIFSMIASWKHKTLKKLKEQNMCQTIAILKVFSSDK